MLSSLIIAMTLQVSSPETIAQDLADAHESPGAAVLIVEASGETLQAVAGLRQKGEPEAIEIGDLWHLGSNTKAMTATLAARLVEAGIIEWNTTIGGTLTDIVDDLHPDMRNITLESLLNHTSGLPANAGMLTMISLSDSDETSDYVEDRLAYANSILRQSPETEGEFVYSNAGYVVAGLMLETVAGESYEVLMEREVFDPLDMGTAGWGPPGTRGDNDQPRGHASGWFGLDAREPGASADNPPAMNSAGRAHMSLEDLGRFLHAHASRPNDYLSEESWSKLHTPPPAGRYALGWGVREDGTLVHSGSNTMWLVQMAVFPDGTAAAAGVNEGRLDVVSGSVNSTISELRNYSD